MKKRKKAAFSLVCSAAILVMEITAMVNGFLRDGVGMFRYYTQDSNLLLLLAVVPWIVFTLRYLRDGIAVPSWVRTAKYIATCTAAVTFTVVVAVLAPAADNYLSLLLGGDMLFTHTLCPLLAVVSLLLFEGEPPLQQIHTWMALIPTAVYAALALVMNVLKLWDGPYPFLRIYEQPLWLSGVWCVVILGGSGLLAWLLRIGNTALHREYVYR